MSEKALSRINAAFDGWFIQIDGPKLADFTLCGRQHVYTSFLYCTAGEPEDVELALAEHAIAEMKQLIETQMTAEQQADLLGSMLLFWRRRPSLDRFLDDRGVVNTRLSFRLVVPDLDFTSLHVLDDEPPRRIVRLATEPPPAEPPVNESEQPGLPSEDGAQESKLAALQRLSALAADLPGP